MAYAFSAQVPEERSVPEGIAVIPFECLVAHRNF